MMKDNMAQQAVYLFSWAQKGQSPNGKLSEETAIFHQHMSYLWTLKGEAEAKMLDDIKAKKD